MKEDKSIGGYQPITDNLTTPPDYEPKKVWVLETWVGHSNIEKEIYGIFDKYELAFNLAITLHYSYQIKEFIINSI